MLRKFTYFSEKLTTLLCEPRYRHSLNVSDTAAKMAHFHGLDITAAKIAGLLHDFARDLSNEKLLEIAETYGLIKSEVELYHPMLLHGPVGVVLIEEEFGLKDPHILGAVARHTVGAPDMSPLEKVIYIADMIEPEREFDGVESLRKLAYDDLDKAMLGALDDTLDYVISKNQLIHPQSVLARNYLLMTYHQVKPKIKQGQTNINCHWRDYPFEYDQRNGHDCSHRR